MPVNHVNLSDFRTRRDNFPTKYTVGTVRENLFPA